MRRTSIAPALLAAVTLQLGPPRRVTNFQDAYPMLSPDGSRVLSQPNRTGDWEIYPKRFGVASGCGYLVASPLPSRLAQRRRRPEGNRGREPSDNELREFSSVLSRKIVVDGFEVKLDCFADIAESVLSRVSFADATWQGGHGGSEATLLTRLQDDLQLHGFLRDPMLRVVATSPRSRKWPWPITRLPGLRWGPTASRRGDS